MQACVIAGNITKDMSVLLAALDIDMEKATAMESGIEIPNLWETAEECPACVLAALRQYCKDKEDIFIQNFDYIYSDAIREFWYFYNRTQYEKYNSYAFPSILDA